MKILITEAERLENTLHAAWVPIASQWENERTKRLARIQTRAHYRTMRRKYRANPNDEDCIYQAIWWEIYGKVPPWKC